jgi:hypothetical protein
LSDFKGRQKTSEAMAHLKASKSADQTLAVIGSGKTNLDNIVKDDS